MNKYTYIRNVDFLTVALLNSASLRSAPTFVYGGKPLRTNRRKAGFRIPCFNRIEIMHNYKELPSSVAYLMVKLITR